MTINPRFREYFQDTFFRENPEEFDTFLKSLEKGIPRTIRIKPGMEKSVKERLESYGFLLESTTIPNVFSLGRADNFDPLERRIGYTPDHLVGNFYIQELAAATSVHILSEGQVHEDKFLILDMAASPGGKTTQLAEQYPESFIIANEPTRERIPQLLQNLDRMGSANIGVTLYPGQYFRKSPEIFDRILLDAPCSGEGTLYKGTDATKHWHLKNIKNIAKLQEKLLDAAIHALRVGGEMVYSTCSMNLLENEGVVDAILKKYPGKCEILYQKRFWPHKDLTGGFFVTKIRKMESLGIEETSSPTNTNDELRQYRGDFPYNLSSEGFTLYEHTGKILVVKKHARLEEVRSMFYFMRFGEMIARREHGMIVSEGHVEKYIDLSGLARYTISDEIELDTYLRGGELSSEREDGIVILEYRSIILGIERIRDTIISNTFPHDWRRK